MTDTQGTSPTDDSAQPNGDAAPVSEHAAPAPDTAAAPDVAPKQDAEPASAPAPATEPPVPPYTSPAASAHNGYPPAPPLPSAQPTYGQAAPAPPRPTRRSARGGQAFGPAATAPSGAHATGTQPTLPYGPGPVGPGAVGPAPVGAPTRPAQKKSGAGRVAGLIVAAALVGGAAGLGGAYAGTQLWGTPSTTVVQGGSTVTVNNPDKVNATTAIAAKVTPSVVTIEVSGGGSGGSGSGVVLSDDGYVATNTHVVTLDGATGTPAIRVTTSDGKIYDAEIVGTDPTYDLAVIKLEDASGLTPIEFADSSELNVGDQTVAIGAPLGLSNTVTTGIVSALNRSISIASSAAPESGTDEDEGEQAPEQGQQGPFQFDIPGQRGQGSSSAGTISIAVIQTDAAINPGNSGGALVDADGKLIGINVAIATAGSSSSDTSGSIGVGFSIPSNIVERVTDEIIADGAATHGLLGASVVPASSVDDATISGAYIQEISSGGAAEAAGIRKGDIVTAFNGVPITDSIDLTAQVRAAAAGSDASVTFVRDGKTQSVDVTLGSLG